MRTLVLAVTLASTAGLALAQGTVIMKLKPEGASKELGYYSPQRVTLSADKPATITKMPEGVTAPMFGVIPISGKKDAKYHVVVDEPEGEPFTLYIDSNGNGDLTDDPKAEWTGKEVTGRDQKQYKQYSGGGVVELGPDAKVHLSGYRFDKTDPGRAQLKDVLLYYRDYATTGEVTLGDKKYSALLADDKSSGDYSGQGTRLLIDVNGDKKFDSRAEAFDAGKPFNIGGTTYELSDISKDGLSFSIKKSDKVVEEIKPDADLSPGKKALAFEATLVDGKKVKFPDDYKGKIVLVDFWATWCGPCIAEMPNVVAAYEQFHGRGFEILGVSLDKPKAEEKIAEVEKKFGIKWGSVYDGGFWDAKVAKLYGIHGIPAAILVDGSTGTILASGGSMRGKNLEKAIEKALTEKGKS
jgi:peroxiredoxin